MKFQTGSKNQFLKLNAGEAVVGIFQGDPLEYKQHFNETTKRGEVCSGTGCEKCLEEKPSFRFRLNFITFDGANYQALVFEQGWKAYASLRALHEGDYNLEKTLVRIARTGTGQGTNYSILPVPNKTLTPEELTAIKSVPLQDLSVVTTTSQTFAPKQNMDDIPF